MLTQSSHVLQQPALHPGHPPVLALPRGLVAGQHRQELPPGAPLQPHARHHLLGSFFLVNLLHFRVVCSRHFVDHLLHGRYAQQAAHRLEWIDPL